MASSKYNIFIGLTALLLIGCRPTIVDNPYGTITIEGWIDSGGHPFVMAHQAYSLDRAEDAPDVNIGEVLWDQTFVFGRATIFDGTDSIILTGRLDTNYLPFFVYTTTKIIGEVGHEYDLKFEYRGRVVSAKTSIPSPIYWDSLSVTAINDQSSRVQGWVSGLQETDHLLVMIKKHDEYQYRLCHLGVINGTQATDGRLLINVLNPYWVRYEHFNPDNAMMFPRYKDSTTYYDVKLARINEQEYEFWESFMAIKSTQGFVFMNTYRNLTSNIVDGNGYWCGMGSDIRTIEIR